MVNDEFLITQDELNRLGHLVNSIINYCFYGQLDKPELEIVKTIMLRANLTDGLASGYQDLFNDQELKAKELLNINEQDLFILDKW